ncbi:MAG: bifunctional phosphatase PAP2/diacylglycerol kinase family protein [Actinomycetota bacterium]
MDISRRTFEGLRELDKLLFKKVSRTRIPMVDKTLLPLSRVANKSVLWMMLAAALAAWGGRFHRRAAMRGVMAVAATSAIANIPIKMIARRARPAGNLVPKTRRLRNVPTSYSFPSGHAASAAAFATGAGLESPVLAAPLGLLAAAVGYSRVHTGVHYPSDVIAGAAIGAGVGLVTRKFWPMALREPARLRGVLTPIEAEPRQRGEGTVIVVNPSAGPALSANPSDELREKLPEAEVIEAAEGEELLPLLRKASREADVVGVAGGDGTVGAAADAAIKAGKPLMVVPSGTLNHLGRDLGLFSVDDAVTAVQRGEIAAVDAATIDGKLFLNTASFGAYSELVDAREKLESKIGKWPALLMALVKVLRTSEPLDVEVNGRSRKIWMIFIGNCRYQPSGFAPSRRERMDDGLLDVRLVDGTQPRARIRLLAAVLTGTLSKSGVYEQWTDRKITIKSRQGPLRLARDGETFDGSSEFVIQKKGKPLAVYAPLTP